MALQGSNLKSLIKKAKEQEKKYQWLESANSYKEASSLLQQDNKKASELHERIGYCFLRAAFQAKTNKQFRNRLKQSADAYQKTISLLQKIKTEDKEAKINHAKAMIAYVNARLESNIPKKRKLLTEWEKLENEALKYYEKVGNKLAIGKICNELAERFFDKRILASNWKDVKEGMLQAINYAEKAIGALSEVKDKYELARAYLFTCIGYFTAEWFRALEIGDEMRKKLDKYSKNSLDLSEKTGDAYLISWANLAAATQPRRPTSTEGLKFFERTKKYGEIAKDNYLIGRASLWMSISIFYDNVLEEDPDKQREEIKKGLKLAQNGIYHLSIIGSYGQRFSAYFGYVEIVRFLITTQTSLKSKRNLLKNAIKIGRENLRVVGEETILHCTVLFSAFSNALHGLSEIETRIPVKRKLLAESLEYREEQLKAMQQISPLDYSVYCLSHYSHAILLTKMAKMESGQTEIELLKKSTVAMENCVELIEKDVQDSPLGTNAGRYGLYYYTFGEILEKLHSLSKDKKFVTRAIENFKVAIKYFNILDLKTRVAESYWQIARLKNYLGENLDSAYIYQRAAKSYKLAAEKLPKLKEFYSNYSDYMQAWSEIEKAKHNHKIEEYSVSRSHYENATKLHESSQLWSYLAPNYLAWANIEKAENFSRNEKTQQAKQAFQEALQQFSLAKESIKQKQEETTTSEEKEMTQKLFESSDLRRKYCQARILLEDAILLDRQGGYLQSSKNYGEASKKFITLSKNVSSETEHKELEYLGILCQAWEKMATAEETTSSESYLEAAELFEKAKDYCYTKKASLWALANSYFCKGLAAQKQFQKTLDTSFHSKANKYIKQAADYYKQAHYQKATDYAKATQRLFDAYLYMNTAEDEIDPGKKTKYYQLAEQLLQIAANSFLKAQQGEKTTKVQSILSTVREEKALAKSLSEVMHAPTIASTTQSFSAPSPTSETSVGLESFEHANVQANLVAGLKEVKVGESFYLSVEFVNAGREPALLMKVEDFIHPEFVIVKKPEIYRIEETTLNMKGKQLAPLKLVEVKLTLQASKKGNYRLNPKVKYLDERGQSRTLQLKTLGIKVEEIHLKNRVSAGTIELDSLLLGGIPSEYAVVLSGSPCDERELLIKNFLKTGIEKDETVFYITTEVTDLEKLLNKPNFSLFLCNPKPKTPIPDLPNVFKLQGKADITNLGIALTKAYRSIDKSTANKRVCVEILSDVLVKHGVNTTREWISGLITNLGAKSFTMMAVINPRMHTSEELYSVLDLFDGEISITQSDDPLDCKKSILVKKLRNQDYIKNQICLR